MPGVARPALSHAAAWLATPIAAVAFASCNTTEESGVPVACKSSPDDVLSALESAPNAVTLDGTSLPDCFGRASDTADVQAVGFSFTEAATELSTVARAKPESDAALELAYLVAAAREGASRTPGIYDELIRRLEQELRGVDTGSKAFVTGERAGRESG